MKRWIGITTSLVALVVLIGLPGAKILIKGRQVDFPCYYSATRLMVKRQDPNNLDFLREEARAHGMEMPGPAPQLAFPAFALTLPIAFFRPQIAMWVWLAMGALCLIGGVAITLAATSRVTLAQFGPALLLTATFAPAIWSLYLGQSSQLVVLFVGLAFFAYVRGRPGVAGFAVGMAGAVKPFPLLLIIHFILRRQWRAVATFAATIVVALLISMAWLGPGYPIRWWHYLGYYKGALMPLNQSLYAGIQRATRVGIVSHAGELLSPVAPQFSATILLVIVAIGVLSCWLFATARMAARKVTTETACLEFAMTLSIAFLLSPFSEEHHASAFVVPIVACLFALQSKRRLVPLAVIGSIAVYVIMNIARPLIWYLEYYRPQLLVGRAIESPLLAFMIFLLFSLPLIGVGLYWLSNTLQCFRQRSGESLTGSVSTPI
ncbi:MAG: DUF2029 domain-containing protein [Armatimonadetes bacterium]|nr:DUF2029 domain-containing protein [Armatimonadota bacterium]NIM24646.1 DUF2029 domain-containing protein [Armatimonadota bacterium]NIM68525.1 DUF2029 domain-containing protein [Armatimonadota bacterium]NIM76907.1 DUF2029 domain-containing protein [Armatimonadota bacterium]NIN06719.1 DUF2029 domain-containing protein [Armatimonadota bacterium]